jgi:predicted dehydrogenase
MRTVGLIGCGHISSTHLKSWKKAKYASVAGVFDLSSELAKKRAEEFGVPKIFTDLDEIIKTCDVLDVCTPPSTHAEIARKIISSGKDLIIEKPLVTDIDSWRSLKLLLNNSRSRLAVLHNIKFGLAVQKAKKLLESGYIGDLIRLNRYFLTHPTADRMLVGQGHWSHKLPGGRWFETMPHELYLTHYFAGWSELETVSIINSPAALSGAPADEVCFVLKGKSCISSFHYSSNCPPNRRYVELIGTKGTIIIDILSDMLFVDRVIDKKWKRAIGMTWIESGKRFLQGIPDRLVYMINRQRGISPHTRIILQFDAYLEGKAASPTPLEEIDFVVEFCEKVGREIDRQVERNQIKSESSV